MNDNSNDRPIPNDFWGPKEWADYYRSIGLAVIPAGRGKNPIGEAMVNPDGTPKLSHKGGQAYEWKHLQGGINQVQHDKMFPAATASFSMGFLTGEANHVGPEGTEKAMFVMDLDVKEATSGLDTWHGIITAHHDGIDLETWEAQTGSRGRHLYFSCDPDKVPQTSKNKWKGIDIRGRGGFIMAPPSPHHVQGTSYEWVVAPWDTEILEAPQWLLDAINGMAPAGSNAPGPETVSTQNKPREAHATGTSSANKWPIPAGVVLNQEGRDPFGNLYENREEKMMVIAFAVVTNAYRDSPIKPPNPKALIQEAWTTYLKARPTTRVPGVTNEVGLNMEDRGLTELAKKVTNYWEKWDTLIAEKAAERPKKASDGASKASATGESSSNSSKAGPAGDGGQGDSGGGAGNTGGGKKKRFHTLSELHSQKPLSYRIDGLMPEDGVGLFGGSSGDGKSFAALHLGLSIGLGRSVHGRKTKPGKVCFCLYEGAPGFGARVEGWLKFHGLDTPENRALIEENVKFVIRGSLVELTNQGEVDAFTADLQEAGINTVFLDTFGKAANVNPNEGKEVRPVYKKMDAMANAIGGNVIFIDHFGKDVMRGVTGTQNKKDDADFVILISRVGDKRKPLERVDMFVDKLKDGNDKFHLYFDVHKVTVELNNPETGEIIKRGTIVLQDDMGFKPKTHQDEGLCEILEDYPEGIHYKELEKIFMERHNTSDAVFRTVKGRLMGKRIRQDDDDLVHLMESDDFG